jgi:hypothetical protein
MPCRRTTRVVLIHQPRSGGMSVAPGVSPGSTNQDDPKPALAGDTPFTRARFTRALELHNAARAAALHFYLFFDDFFLDEDFFFGTLPPAFRASDNPIAIACFLLVTFFPERPLLSVPFFRSCIAFSTFSCAFLPYLAIITFSFRWSRLQSAVVFAAQTLVCDLPINCPAFK